MGIDLRDGLGIGLMRFGSVSYVSFKDKGGFLGNDLGN